MSKITSAKPSSQNNLGKLLLSSVQKIKNLEDKKTKKVNKNEVFFNVPTVGSKVSATYEQIRNASEYENYGTLRQRATKRFLKRTLSFTVRNLGKNYAEELITELTQAEYIQNNSITKKQISSINSDVKKYYSAYWTYSKIEDIAHKKINFKNWIIDVLSVRIDNTIEDNIRGLSFLHFAISYLNDQIELKDIIQKESNIKIEDDDKIIVLYIALNKAILESNNATIRTALIDSYHQDIGFLHRFEEFNNKLDVLLDSNTVNYATRIISRNGATLRIIYQGFYSKNTSLDENSLKDEDRLAYDLEDFISSQYYKLDKTLDSGVLKSIIFLLITKGIIGLAIEVPYDLLVIGELAWLPLIMNLLFPAAFIALSRITLTPPDNRNTKALINQIESILMSDSEDDLPSIKLPKKNTSPTFTFIYSIIFILAFSGLAYLLFILGFNIVQGIIFFIFLSTASYLAFRMSLQIRKLEVTEAPKGSIALLRDIIYLPFIQVGQTISMKYAKLNIVSTFLDMVIEMPLKSALRTIRGWTSFISNKKDDLI